MNKVKRQQIENEDLSFLAPRLEKKGMEKGEIKTLVREYKRYLILRLADFPKELPIYSVPIDEVWHAHILHTQAYRTFCDKVFGAYLDHRPYSAAEFNERLPEYFSVTLPMYREIFGETEPACWHIT